MPTPNQSAFPTPEELEAYVAQCAAVAAFEARMRALEWTKQAPRKTEYPKTNSGEGELTIQDVARIKKVSPVTVRRWINTGMPIGRGGRIEKLPATKVGGTLRIDREDFERWNHLFELSKQ